MIEDLQWADASTLDLLRALAVGLPARAALVRHGPDRSAGARDRALDDRRARPGRRPARGARPVRSPGSRAPGGRGDGHEPGIARRACRRRARRPVRRQPVPRPRAGRRRRRVDARAVRRGAGIAARHPRFGARRPRRRCPGRAPRRQPRSGADRRPGPRHPCSIARSRRSAARSGRRSKPACSTPGRGAAVGAPMAGPAAPRFRHAIQRDVLIERLGPGERRMLHGRYADALEAGDPDPSRASAIAQHRDAAGDDARSLPAHIAAMATAERAFAFDAAAAHGARAAALRVRVSRDGDGDAEAAVAPGALVARCAAGGRCAGIRRPRASCARARRRPRRARGGPPRPAALGALGVGRPCRRGEGARSRRRPPGRRARGIAARAAHRPAGGDAHGRAGSGPGAGARRHGGGDGARGRLAGGGGAGAGRSRAHAGDARARGRRHREPPRRRWPSRTPSAASTGRSWATP